jgi:hypothetical protein
VARLAHIRCRHVRRALACRIDAVVTAHAVADDARMFEARGLPRECVVARAAVQIGREMRRGFAGSANIVVARGATSTHFGVFESRRGDERDCGMAGVAIVGARNVRRGFRRRCDSRSLGVAAVAVARRSFEYGVDVT